ncbi:site-specific integrase, partial [Aurantimonas sp. A2-1-M11]|uniref:site-specific integrase n=1 Tax=Aurantimonas sp. A2-1-M11 TaxID=3113712 RepID=UPI002F93984B
MKQARVLTDAEFKRLMAVVGQGRHAARNRLAFILSYQAGLRVGEIAALALADVLDREDQVREHLRLSATITKGGHARIVFVNDRLRREIAAYVCTLGTTADRKRPLLVTQKGAGFSANTLCQLMGRIYAATGLDGASSGLTGTKESGVGFTSVCSHASLLHAHRGYHFGLRRRS